MKPLYNPMKSHEHGKTYVSSCTWLVTADLVMNVKEPRERGRAMGGELTRAFDSPIGTIPRACGVACGMCVCVCGCVCVCVCPRVVCGVRCSALWVV
jgi:hypothetical protein